MFCKFCGKQINRETMRCIGCGKEVGPLEGGVGFWDLAGIKPPSNPQNELPMSDKKTEKIAEQSQLKRERKNKKIAVLLTAVAGLLALNLVFNVVIFGVMLGLKRDNARMTDSLYIFNAQSQEQSVEHNDETDPQESTVQTDPGQNPDTAETGSHGAEMGDVEIVYKNPRISIREDRDHVFFEDILVVKGRKLEFEWEKLDPEKSEWMTVDERFIRDESRCKGMVTIWQLLLYPDVYGKYRCNIKFADGEQEYTETIVIEVCKETVGEE